jgi:hypothetical protein
MAPVTATAVIAAARGRGQWAPTYREQDAQLVLEQESVGYGAVHERKIWEQIWEQNSVKQAQISATGRPGWDN